jgi:alpha-mannosidase
LTYSLSVLPHTGQWDEAEVWRQALARNNPPRAVTAGMVKNQLAPARGNRPGRQSFLSVAGRNAILSALKKAEASEDLILRLYNPSSTPTQATVQLPFVPQNVQLAGLDEQPRTLADAEAAPSLAADGQVQVSLPAGKIVTLIVRCA